MSAPESSVGATDRRPSVDLARPSRRIWRLCVKELRETLRDRRTMITLILMPLIVYPLLSIIFQRFLIDSWQATKAPTCIVGVESEADAELLGSVVLTTTRQRQPQTSFKKRDRSAATKPADIHWNWPSEDWLDFEIEVAVVDNIDSAVESEAIDVGLRVSPTATRSEAPAWVEILHRPDSSNSRRARETLERYFSIAREAYLQQRLRSASVNDDLPVRMRYRAISTPSSDTLSLATLIPLALVLMTVTGAVYPAIDLTAGERKRGTMEALIAAPVPRMGLLFAKYVAVLTVAILTATANLVAMTLTLWSSGVAKTIFGSSSISFGTLLSVFGLMVLFAAFFSSVLLTVTSFARSFKEAQAYLIPLILLSLGPSLFCLAPGIELTGVVAVTPLVNIVLLARNALEGRLMPSMAILCVISTVFYAAAALAIAAKVFGSDAILYGSPTGWRDVFRRSECPSKAATLASAFGGLAVLFPAYVILAGALAQLGESSLTFRLTLTVAVTVALFGVFPWLIALWGRVSMRDGFELRRVSWLALLGCVTLGLSIWPGLQMLVIWQGSVGEAQFELVEAFHTQARELSPWAILLSMAIVPAVFEELFFRGFLFSAIRERLSAQWTIVLTALLFGAFHVLAKDALATERFLPTTCMGLVLGWVCWRTHSVFPGMVLHACHNSILLLMFYYRDELDAAGFGAGLETVPWSWLLVSVCGIAAGVTLVTLGRSLESPRHAAAYSSQSG